MKHKDAVTEINRKAATHELERRGAVSVALADVEKARDEYLRKLDLARMATDPKSGWSLKEDHRLEIDVFKLRYEALSDELRAKQRDIDAEEAKVLARTNTQLYGGQMWIAAGILLATIAQVAIALFKK